ncbi:carboxypeptidase regulatory-like domain-containing protein, partial [Candidatus Cloacimonadota bacterium]
MKKLIIFLLFVLSCLTILFARTADNRVSMSELREGREFQWDEQNSNFPNASTGINFMCAVDENIVWAAGYDGGGTSTPYQIVTHTTNGGSSWTATQINTAPTNGDAAMIYAISDMKAWVPIHTGSPQGIYYTEDGGATWIRQETADYNLTGSFPNVVHFFNENDGFAQGDPVGGYYELYTTSDGGTNWTRVPQADIPAPLAGEWGIVGYYDAVGDNIWWGTQKGRVFYSNDKGLTWEVSQTPLGASTYTDVRFKDDLNGIAQDKNAASTGTICETSDGGITWLAVTHSGNCFTNDYEYVQGTENTYVSTGAATGFSGASYSYDGGHNWFDFEESGGVQFLATSWINSTTGWAGCFNDQTNPGLSGVYKYTGDLIPIPMGTIEGFVTDADEGFGIEDATITLGTFETQTVNSGEYSMLLETGIYTLTCELAGYETYTQNDVEIIEGQTTTIDILLQNLYLPPTNLGYQFSNPNVVLTWTAPEGTGLTGYNVYRDDAEIANITSTLYIDPNLSTGTYTYYVTALYGTYESIPSNEVVVEVVSSGNNMLSNGAELAGNYPNPFNPSTVINYSVGDQGHVFIEVFNVKGEKVAVLRDGILEPGNYNETWNGSDSNGNPVSSGVYF